MGCFVALLKITILILTLFREIYLLISVILLQLDMRYWIISQIYEKKPLVFVKLKS